MSSAAPTLWDRFWAKVDMDGDCWVWTAYTERGYGRIFTEENRKDYAHRVSYQLLVGRIPDRFDIDHLCRNHSCVNPDHLEPVSRSVNAKRGIRYAQQQHAAAMRTHCGNGHAFTPENVVYYAGFRRCRECNRERDRRLRADRRAAIKAEVAALSAGVSE